MSNTASLGGGGGGGSGDVVGPASSNDNGFVLFDGITGKLIKAGPYMVGSLDEITQISPGNAVRFGTLDATTNSAVVSMNNFVQSTGVPVAGFGSTHIESVENTIGAFPNTWQRQVTYLDPTSGSEDVLVEYMILVAGAATTIFSYSGVETFVQSSLRTNKGRVVKTGLYTTDTLDAEDHYVAVDTSGGAVTITLPLTPENGRTYTIVDGSLNAVVNNITVNGNGINIAGITSAATYTINTNGAAITVTYINLLNVWKIS